MATDMMESVVDKAINKVKEVYDIQIPHPDHPEEKEAMDAAAAKADAATGGSSSSTGGAIILTLALFPVSVLS